MVAFSECRYDVTAESPTMACRCSTDALLSEPVLQSEHRQVHQRSPLGWASGQTNAYAYVAGSPVSRKDPLGLAGIIPDPNGVVPGGPWTPNPQAPRPGNSLGRKQSSGQRAQCQFVPSEENGGPRGSRGYWKTLTPRPGEQKTGWIRCDLSGKPITPDEAYPGPRTVTPLEPTIEGPIEPIEPIVDIPFIP